MASSVFTSPGENRASGGIEGKAVHVHAPLEREVVVERHRATGHAQRHDPWHVDRRQSRQRRAVEPPAGRAREAGAVGPSRPPAVVQGERLLERRPELVQRPRDGDVHRPEAGELAPPPAVQAPLLRRRLGSVHGVPAVREVEHRSLDALDHLEAVAERGRDPALRRKAVEVDDVAAALSHTPDERFAHLAPRARREEDVGEDRLGAAHEGRHPQPGTAAHDERERSDEPPVTASHVDPELCAGSVVTAPLGEPAVQQERARTRHRAHELVPLGLECLEALGGRDGLDHAHPSGAELMWSWRTGGTPASTPS